MELVVNGETRRLEGPMTIGQLLNAYSLKAALVVVEHNGVIIPRDRYDAVELREGDTLEIVQMMAGG